jgi:hypothetical protein
VRTIVISLLIPGGEASFLSWGFMLIRAWDVSSMCMLCVHLSLQ